MSEAAVALDELRSFPQYPEYEDSQVTWLGKLPAGWIPAPLKSILVRNDSGVWGDDFDPDGTIVLRSTDVTVSGEWRVESPARRSLSPKEKAAALLSAGDLVVTKSSGSALHLGKTALVTKDVSSLECCFSNFMQRLRVNTETDARFISYVLNSPVGREQMNFFGSTTTGLANLNGHLLGMIRAPLAPTAEQHAIANLLDQETSKIDALVAKKELLIELLQEKRTALITHAVTKGLDPNARMKPSGIDWLGDIPAHWELKPLSTVIERITYGFTNPMPTADDGPFMLTANDIGDGEILYESARRTTPEAFDNELTDKSRPRAGDILITKDGTLGRVAVADGTRLCINQSVALLRVSARKASVDFVQNALRAAAYQDRMIFEAGGTTIKHIYITRLIKMPVAFPPMIEQDQICTYVAVRRNALDAVIGRVRTGIERLREYRTALISAAVTGKIDVREEVA